MHNMLQAPRGRFASEGRSAVFSLLSNFWDFMIFFFFCFLQEDVPQLQGEGHRTQPKNQVHTPDGHRASGRPSIQIRGQQMVRTSQHLHTQMSPQILQCDAGSSTIDLVCSWFVVLRSESCVKLKTEPATAIQHTYIHYMIRVPVFFFLDILADIPCNADM